MLPGALLRNAGLKYICKHRCRLKVATSLTVPLPQGYNAGDVIGSSDRAP